MATFRDLEQCFEELVAGSRRGASTQIMREKLAPDVLLERWQQEAIATLGQLWRVGGGYVPPFYFFRQPYVPKDVQPDDELQFNGGTSVGSRGFECRRDEVIYSLTSGVMFREGGIKPLAIVFGAESWWKTAAPEQAEKLKADVQRGLLESDPEAEEAFVLHLCSADGRYSIVKLEVLPPDHPEGPRQLGAPVKLTDDWDTPCNYGPIKRFWWAYYAPDAARAEIARLEAEAEAEAQAGGQQPDESGESERG